MTLPVDSPPVDPRETVVTRFVTAMAWTGEIPAADAKRSVHLAFVGAVSDALPESMGLVLDWSPRYGYVGVQIAGRGARAADPSWAIMLVALKLKRGSR